VYLNVQKYPENDIQLLFKFGPKNSNRFWNINIAFLPSGADYLGRNMQYCSMILVDELRFLFINFN